MDVKDEKFLIDLPAKPDWFDAALENIERVGGKPLFRCVDGQREMAWRNGKMDVKYLLQSDGQPCYARIPRYKYRRKTAKGDYVEYFTRSAAEIDDTPGLFKLIETGVSYEVRAVGRPCWVIEVYIPPENIPVSAWMELRYQYYEKDGILQKYDVLGEYPSEGRYIFCVDVIDSEGNAIAPHQRLIDELKRRKALQESDGRSYEQSVNDAVEAQEKFERKQFQQITDNFYQEQAFSGRRMHHAEHSKPIMAVKE